MINMLQPANCQATSRVRSVIVPFVATYSYTVISRQPPFSSGSDQLFLILLQKSLQINLICPPNLLFCIIDIFASQLYTHLHPIFFYCPFPFFIHYCQMSISIQSSFKVNYAFFTHGQCLVSTNNNMIKQSDAQELQS